MAFDRKDWKEFRETGLFHFVNSFLHMFGWAIVVAEEDDGTVSAVYPARTDFRGFSVESNDKAYARVTAFMQKEFGPAAESKTESEPMIDLHDWNDISNTKIPLNEEIFALLEDRMNPEKLCPAVIIAKMEPARSISWAERTEGDVLCYDITIGNFHCCNGAEIKYWKHVNVPSKQAESGILERNELS